MAGDLVFLDCQDCDAFVCSCEAHPTLAVTISGYPSETNGCLNCDEFNGTYYIDCNTQECFDLGVGCGSFGTSRELFVRIEYTAVFGVCTLVVELFSRSATSPAGVSVVKMQVMTFVLNAVPDSVSSPDIPAAAHCHGFFGAPCSVTSDETCSTLEAAGAVFCAMDDLTVSWADA